MAGSGEAISVRQAGAKAMLAQLERMSALAAAAIEGRDPEAVHHMRVATRRMRAAARAFAEGFGEEELGPIVASLRWIAGALGKVRDEDVFLAWVDGVAAPALGGPRGEAERERAARQGELAEALRGERFGRFIDGGRAALAGAADSDSRRGGAAAEQLKESVKKRKKQLRALLGKLGGDASAEDLHALRIKAKRLRYTAEFLAALESKPKRTERLIRRLERLQETLGAIHDSEARRGRLLAAREGAPTEDGAWAAILASEREALARLRREYERERDGI